MHTLSEYHVLGIHLVSTMCWAYTLRVPCFGHTLSEYHFFGHTLSEYHIYSGHTLSEYHVIGIHLVSTIYIMGIHLVSTMLWAYT